MRTVGLTEARDRLAEIVQEARYTQTPTTLTHYGRPVAVLVSPDWYESHKGGEDTQENTRGALPENPGRE